MGLEQIQLYEEIITIFWGMGSRLMYSGKLCNISQTPLAGPHKYHFYKVYTEIDFNMGKKIFKYVFQDAAYQPLYIHVISTHALIIN